MEIAGATAGGEFPAAQFILKTYKIVSNPSNASIISWSQNNNSFIVFDPFAFSQTLLPTHFKHSNFSSFIRQLNTYGFKKVDPDRWEFAHACFRRDQTELLRRIVRRRKERVGDEIAMEVVRLKEEQRMIDERMEGLWIRVREAEKRRRQIVGFLARVFEDANVLGFLGFGNEEDEGIKWEKKVRRRIDDFRV